jgi:ribosome-dependent ATPase
LQVLGGPIEDRHHRNTLYPLIAFMPQGLGGNLYPELSISENIRFFGTLFGLSKAECEERMQQLLKATDLAALCRSPGGQALGRHETKARAVLRTDPRA